MSQAECCTFVLPDGRVCGLHPIAHAQYVGSGHRFTPQSPAVVAPPVPLDRSRDGLDITGAQASVMAHGDARLLDAAGALEKHPPQPAFQMVALGQPAPQGSKRHVGHGVMIESSKKVKPWREAVKFAALEARDEWRAGWLHDHWEPLDGPLDVLMVFTFARPAGHFGTGRNSLVLKASAPLYPIGPPDSSKILRSTEDALVDSGVIKDDSRLVHHEVWKVYPGGHPDALRIPGVVVRIWHVTS